MLYWLQANLASIAVALVLLCVTALIIRKMIRDKKAGRHSCGGSCGGGCGSCPMQGRCHGE